MAKETKGGVWVNVNSNENKGHINIYDKDPKGEHNSIHINIDYNTGNVKVTEKEDGKKTTTDLKCYLTTACMRKYKNNFDDNCYELTVLRWLRDFAVSQKDIIHYYKTAPIIVEAINSLENADEVWKDIFENVISVCVQAIEVGNIDFAYQTYKNSVINLEEEFAKPLLYSRLVRALKQNEI